MSTRAMPWPIFGVLACFSESDMPLGGTDSNGSSGATTELDASATLATTVASSSGPMTDAVTTDPTGDASTNSSASSDPTTTDPTLDDTGTETGECPAGNEPIPLPLPVGWDGVYAIARGDPEQALPPCPDGLLPDAVVAEAPFEPVCTCSCDPGCWVDGYLDASCGDVNDIAAGYDESCASFLDAETALFANLLEDELADSNDCETPSVAGVVETSGRHHVCLHGTGEPCIVAPDDDAVVGPCVSHAGDLPCPNGEYSERHLTAIDASTSCDECSPCLEAAVLACQAGSITVYPELDCGGTSTPAGNQLCADAAGLSMIVDIELACPAPLAEPVELVGARTYCCVP